MATNCNLGGLICTVVASKDGRGDPIKPTYYIELWALLPLVIAAVLIGRWSKRKG